MLKKISFVFIVVTLQLVAIVPSFAAGGRISTDVTEVSLTEGQIQVVTVELDEPIICPFQDETCNVTIPISSTDSRVVLSVNSITFAYTEWFQQKQFTITLNDDGTYKPAESETVVLSPAISNAEYYNSYNPSDITVNLPSTGQPATPTISLSQSTVSAGSEITISGASFKPNSDVTVTLYSTPTVLGIATTDSNGGFSRAFTIPKSATPGSHQLVVSGLNILGQDFSASSSMTVIGLPATGSDTKDLTLISIILISVGLVLMRVRRKSLLK